MENRERWIHSHLKQPIRLNIHRTSSLEKDRLAKMYGDRLAEILGGAMVTTAPTAPVTPMTRGEVVVMQAGTQEAAEVVGAIGEASLTIGFEFV